MKKKEFVSQKKNASFEFKIVCTLIVHQCFFFTSCSTSIGISRTPLFSGELNGL